MGFEAERPVEWERRCCCVTAQHSKACSVGSCHPLDKNKQSTSKYQTSFQEHINPFPGLCSLFAWKLAGWMFFFHPHQTQDFQTHSSVTATSILQILRPRTSLARRQDEAAPSSSSSPRRKRRTRIHGDPTRERAAPPCFTALDRNKTKLVQSLKFSWGSGGRK